MDWLWTWGGKSFGYRSGYDLLAYHGLQVGIFHGDENYGRDGCYLGELMNGGRLITDLREQSWRQPSFAPMPKVHKSPNEPVKPDRQDCWVLTACSSHDEKWIHFRI